MRGYNLIVPAHEGSTGFGEKANRGALTASLCQSAGDLSPPLPLGYAGLKVQFHPSFSLTYHHPKPTQRALGIFTFVSMLIKPCLCLFVFFYKIKGEH